MSDQPMICPQCTNIVPPKVDYCPNCGEVLSPLVKAELQRLAIVIRDLDKRISANKGSQTVASLRAEHYQEYQELRRAPWQRAATATPPAGETAQPKVTLKLPTPAREASTLAPTPGNPPAPALPKPMPTLQRTASTTSEFIPTARIAEPVASMVSRAESAPIPAAQPAPPPRPAAPPPPPVPAGPVFSWRAFAAEQAIAIIAYLGGFLALIATLTLVVSNGQTQQLLTISIVTLVYFSFGIAGFILRQAARLRTVSRVYLAVFALMTPLEALALYRYEFEKLHVSAPAMLCMSAAYACMVYMALAVQTRFITYSYLSWVALIVSAQAIVPWVNAPAQWWIFDLGVTTVLLLIPHRLRHFERLHILAEPATQIAALSTLPVVAGVQYLGIVGLDQTVVVGAFPDIYIDAGALALSACIQVPITAGWRLTIPSWRPRQQSAIVDTIDGFNAVFFAEAVGGVAIWITTKDGPVALDVVARPVAMALTVTALFEFGLAVAIHRWQTQRRGLRIFLEILTLLLASGSAWIVSSDPAPNWPMIFALSAALVISVGAALIDGKWWLLVSGYFLITLYYHLAQVFIPASLAKENQLTLYVVLTLALWLVGMVAGSSERAQRFGGPIYVVTLCYALYTLNFMGGHSAWYQTGVLLAFLVAAFIGGLREQRPVIGSLVMIFFGVLVPFPLSINNSFTIISRTGTVPHYSPYGLALALLTLGLALAAIGARRVWGRTWAIAWYVVALWAVFVVGMQMSLGTLPPPDTSATGLPFPIWFLLFFMVLSFVVARWEGSLEATVVPAALAIWMLVVAVSDPAQVDGIPLSLLALGLTLAALVARKAWGRRWAMTPYGIALLAIIITAAVTTDGSIHAPDWTTSGLPYTTWFLLFFAALTYAIVRREGEPLATAIPAGLAAWAYLVALNAPKADGIPLSALTLGLVFAALATRRAWGYRWALALYAVALAAIIITAAQAEVGGLHTPNWSATGLSFTSWFLLFFAVVTYGVALWENESLATIIPAGLALWAYLAAANTPGSASAIPVSILTLGLTLAAITARALWGRLWALGPYGVALVAIVLTAAQTSAGALHTPDWTPTGLPYTSWFLLFFAVITYGVTLGEGEPAGTIIAAALAYWAIPLATNDLAGVVLVFGLIAVGMALRQVRGRGWGLALEVAAAVGSINVAVHLGHLSTGGAMWQVIFLMAMAFAAYLVALQEGEYLLSGIAVVYALVAVSLVPSPDNLIPTVILTFTFTGLAAIHRLPALDELYPRKWAFAPYTAAIGSSFFATQRVVPFDAGTLEGLLLVFAAIAYALVAMEEAPLFTVLPTIYAVAAVVAQPDVHALLPLAIGFALLGMLAGRVAGIRWSWGLYVAASVAAAATIIQGEQHVGFQALSLVVLALLVYVVSAVESRPDVLLVALVLGLFAMGRGADALQLASWQATLGFLAVGWVYVLAGPIWEAIPWMHMTQGMWWVDTGAAAQAAYHLDNPRVAGKLAHRVSGTLVATGATLIALAAPHSFEVGNQQTLIAAIGLLSMAGMLLVVAPRPPMQMGHEVQPSWLRLIVYVAGQIATLAITWFARYLGADNVQAVVLAPGSYLLLVGVFLPADRRVPYARRIGQFASLSGSLVLLLPTLYQSFHEPSLNTQVFYIGAILAEALVITGLGVGTHSRSLVLLGIAFVVLDAINASILAINKGVPIALVVGVMALLLISLATWLSLRTRRESPQS
jgi:hypothetical protein